jgi:site-specific recombinase XerD
MRHPSKALMALVQKFFRDHLASQKGVSPNTVVAYRDAIKLFLHAVARHARKPVASLGLDDLTARAALTFLDELEAVRKNSAVTRNLRLAALRTFFMYLCAEDPLRAGEYQRVIAIPLKRAIRSVMGYLEVKEINAILAGVDRKRPGGERDYVLLTLLYNTGARVQEICDLTVGAVRLESPAIVTLRGKGKKTRLVPLWAQTADLLRKFLDKSGRIDNSNAPLFANAKGEAIGRFGVRYIVRKTAEDARSRCPSLTKKKIGPHTYRHTCAMHMLQSGIELSVIRSWLGHVNLATTNAYVEIDLEMKSKALAQCRAPSGVSELPQILKKHRDVIDWLDTL